MRSLLFLSSVTMLCACAPSAHAAVGDVARYAPAYAGYVVGSTRPILLRNPLTNDKIQCREELERFLPTLAAAVTDDVRDRYWRDTSPLVLAPFTAVGHVGTAVGVGLLLPAVGVWAAFASTSSRTLYVEASDAFVAGRFQDARDRFLALLLGATGIEALPRPWREISVYYLALSDEALHRNREAASAYERFILASSLEDELRYRDAERRLRAIDPGRFPVCRSRADLTLTWRGAP